MKSLLFLLTILAFSKAEDFYQMLGVSRDADEKAIKKAFKLISLEHHPDRSDENSQQNFMKLSHAYEVLTTPAKREIYDRFGEDALKKPRDMEIEAIYSCYFGFKNPEMFYQQMPLFRDGPVTELDGNNIKNLYRRNEIWMVQFYGPRCRHVQAFTGQWVGLADRLQGIARVAAVNCEDNEGICTEFGIKKYPHIIYFPESTIIDHETYNGERTANAMNDFAVSRMTGFFRYVNFNTLNEFLQSDTDQVKLITFTNTKEPIPIFKALSREFKGKVVFGEARSSDSELVKKYSIASFPALLFITHNEHELYQGPYVRNHIESWIFKKIDSHKIAIFAKELNRGIYATGNCNSNDSRYCLIVFDPDEDTKKILDGLAVEFHNDPVSIFWMNSEKYPGFYAAFERPAVIYRGKKNKFIDLDCGKEYSCFKDSIVSMLSGGGKYQRIKVVPEISERKAEL